MISAEVVISSVTSSVSAEAVSPDGFARLFRSCRIRDIRNTIGHNANAMTAMRMVRSVRVVELLND